MELYGSVRNYIVVPLTPQTGGKYAFRYDDNLGFEVEGTLKPVSTGLRTNFTKLSFHGLSYCTTGEYTFGRES